MPGWKTDRFLYNSTPAATSPHSLLRRRAGLAFRSKSSAILCTVAPNVSTCCSVFGYKTPYDALDCRGIVTRPGTIHIKLTVTCCSVCRACSCCSISRKHTSTEQATAQFKVVSADLTHATHNTTVERIICSDGHFFLVLAR